MNLGNAKGRNRSLPNVSKTTNEQQSKNNGVSNNFMNYQKGQNDLKNHKGRIFQSHDVLESTLFTINEELDSPSRSKI